MDLCHLVAEAVWRKAQQAGVYRPITLQTEGFIHCSLPEQVDAVASRYYAGCSDLLLVTIDSDAARAPLVFEDTTGSGEQFPHLYGPLNLDAVIRVHSYP